MKSPIFIPSDYVSGRSALATSTPYWTPGAIQHVHQHFDLTDVLVIEAGSGGSTLFFSERCSQVITFESDKNGWGAKIASVLAQRKIKNVELIQGFAPSDPTPLYSACKNLPPPKCPVLLAVDSGENFNREEIQKILMSWAGDYVRFIVADNFGDVEHWHRQGTLSTEEAIAELGSNWDGAEYRDPAWRGYGTRVFWRTDK